MKKIFVLVILSLSSLVSHLSSLHAQDLGNRRILTEGMMGGFGDDYSALAKDELASKLDRKDWIVEYEWCRAKGKGFSVGLRHDTFREGDGEIKWIVIKKDGEKTAYPMIHVGNGSTLPETTIHVRGTKLYIELKDEESRQYFLYDYLKHTLNPSTRKAYLGK